MAYPTVQHTMSTKLPLLYSVLGLVNAGGEGDPLWYSFLVVSGCDSSLVVSGGDSCLVAAMDYHSQPAMDYHSQPAMDYHSQPASQPASQNPSLKVSWTNEARWGQGISLL